MRTLSGKAFFYGFNSYTYNAVLNQWNYQANTQTTYSRPDLVTVGAQDYLEVSGLDEYYTQDYLYNEELALSFRDAARAELEGKATFPVKIKVTYNTSGTISKRYQVLEQQLEKLLGEDFIDIILAPYSGSSFNASTPLSYLLRLRRPNWFSIIQTRTRNSYGRSSYTIDLRSMAL